MTRWRNGEWGAGARVRALRAAGVLRQGAGAGRVPSNQVRGPDGPHAAAVRLQAPVPGAAVHEHRAAPHTGHRLSTAKGNTFYSLWHRGPTTTPGACLTPEELYIPSGYVFCNGVRN